ncbi:hypothetical protein ACHAQJ_006517 [Trichoderma viride]
MQPQSTSPSVADSSEMMLPPMSGALPIAADSALEQPSMPRPRERHYRSRSSLVMEVLSRRMSRQTLLQQHQPRSSQPPLTPQSTSLLDNATLDSSSLCASTDMTMEMDLDDINLCLPVPPSAQNIRPSRRYLPLPYLSPTVPETTIDPDVASRVLARMQADTLPATGSTSASTSSSSMPAIEIDSSEQANADLEADEGYSEGPDEYPWMGDKLVGSLSGQGILSFTTSAEAAMRCPKLVRNVPRMRKRSHKKKEHRIRASKETTGGETSQLQTPAGNAAEKEAAHTPAVAL